MKNLAELPQAHEFLVKNYNLIQKAVKDKNKELERHFLTSRNMVGLYYRTQTPNTLLLQPKNIIECLLERYHKLQDIDKTMQLRQKRFWNCWKPNVSESKNMSNLRTFKFFFLGTQKKRRRTSTIMPWDGRIAGKKMEA